MAIASVKSLLMWLRYRRSKNDLLVLSWFVLSCGIGCAALGSVLGEPLRGFRHLGLMGIVFIFGLYAHTLRTRREASKKEDSHARGSAD